MAARMTKAQRAEQRAAARQQRAARMKRELGETIARKAGLVGAGYVAGIAPGMGPARTSTVMAVVGWGGALAVGGRAGAALEGIGDAGAAITTERMGAEKRARLGRTHFLRGPFFEAAGTGAPAASQVRAIERRAFAAGQLTGIRRGARDAVGALRDDDDDDDGLEAAGGHPDELLIEQQRAERTDGL